MQTHTGPAAKPPVVTKQAAPSDADDLKTAHLQEWTRRVEANRAGHTNDIVSGK
jgi:hypothetical protein